MALSRPFEISALPAAGPDVQAMGEGGAGGTRVRGRVSVIAGAVGRFVATMMALLAVTLLMQDPDNATKSEARRGSSIGDIGEIHKGGENLTIFDCFQVSKLSYTAQFVKYVKEDAASIEADFRDESAECSEKAMQLKTFTILLVTGVPALCILIIVIGAIFTWYFACNKKKNNKKKGGKARLGRRGDSGEDDAGDDDGGDDGEE